LLVQLLKTQETRHGFLILRDLWLVGVAVLRPRRSPVLVEFGWLEQRRSRSASFPVVRSTPRPGVEDDGLASATARRRHDASERLALASPPDHHPGAPLGVEPVAPHW